LAFAGGGTAHAGRGPAGGEDRRRERRRQVPDARRTGQHVRQRGAIATIGGGQRQRRQVARAGDADVAGGREEQGVRLLHVGAAREQLRRQPARDGRRGGQGVDGLAALDSRIEQRARVAPEQHRERGFGQLGAFRQVREGRFGGGCLGLVLMQVQRRAGAAS